MAASGAIEKALPKDDEDDGEGRHDAVVAILNERGFACSGVLIGPRAVLTARHCRRGKRVVFGNRASELRVVIPVTEVRGAPNRAIDLALMFLERDAPVAPYAIRLDTQPPRSVRVVGFGCHPPDNCAPSGRRSYFDAVLPMGRWGCDADAAAQTGCLPDHELLLRRSAGSDTCVGDSGGAVLEQTEGDWRLVAITSRGVRDSVLRCGDGGIYVRVEPHQSWIDKEMRKRR